jgi:hypothetical protein
LDQRTILGDPRRVPRRYAPASRSSGPKRKTSSLTDEERGRLRAVLKNLRRAHGSWAKLGEAMDVSIDTLLGVSKGKDFGSIDLAHRAAKIAGMLVEDLLHGKPVDADHCPHCRQPLPRRR